MFRLSPTVLDLIRRKDDAGKEYRWGLLNGLQLTHAAISDAYEDRPPVVYSQIMEAIEWLSAYHRGKIDDN